MNSQQHEVRKVEKGFNFNNFSEQKAPRPNKNSDLKSSQNFNLSSPKTEKTVLKHAENNNKLFVQPNFQFDFGKNKSSKGQTALLKTQQKSDSEKSDDDDDEVNNPKNYSQNKGSYDTKIYVIFFFGL